MSKITLFIILLFLFLASITGFYITKTSTRPESKITKKGIEKTTENEEIEVVIRMNKREYKQGEEVKVSIDYNRDLYVWDYPWSCWLIQRKVNNSWIDLKLGLTPCVTECKDVPPHKIIDCRICQLEPPAWSLRRGSPITFTWDQRYIADDEIYQCYYKGKIISQKCMIYQQAPPGEYKVRFEYALNIQNENVREGVDIKYTEKVFTIREHNLRMQ